MRIQDIENYLIQIEKEEAYLSQLEKLAKGQKKSAIFDIILAAGAAFAAGMSMTRGSTAYICAMSAMSLGYMWSTMRDIKNYKSERTKAHEQLSRIEFLKEQKPYQDYLCMQEMLNTQPQKSEQASPSP